jgi:hypothetical protein
MHGQKNIKLNSEVMVEINTEEYWGSKHLRNPRTYLVRRLPQGSNYLSYKYDDLEAFVQRKCSPSLFHVKKIPITKSAKLWTSYVLLKHIKLILLGCFTEPDVKLFLQNLTQSKYTDTDCTLLTQSVFHIKMHWYKNISISSGETPKLTTSTS